MTRAAGLALLTIACGTGCVPDAGRPERTVDVYQTIVEAEDARPSGGDALNTLLQGTQLEDPFLRRTAVRALGRLENPGLSEAAAEHLDDADVGVRDAAAEALAQSVHGGDGSPVLDDLLGRVEREADATVRGTLARSIGRLVLSESDSRRAEGALLRLSGTGADEPPETLVGVALGFESLVRRSGGRGLSRPAADVLLELMAVGESGQVRSLAASALGQSRRLSADLLRQGLDDPEPEVRRVVVAFLDAAPPSARQELLRRALADSSTAVAIQALQYLAAASRTAPRCEQLISAAEPESEPAVRLVALAALARPCPALGPQRAVLARTAAELDDPAAPWQIAARSLLSLATVDTDATAGVLPRFVEHPDPFVRAWAARTASAIRAVPTLLELSGDPSPNVRAEALRGLFAVEGHELDDVLLGQLDGNDPQLLITVAALLEGAPDRPLVAGAALAALERISESERETWRDARLALLERVEELGDESLSGRLVPFLADYDPAVAHATVGLLETWTGGEYLAEPELLPRPPVPGVDERARLEGARLTLHMRGGDALVIELLVDQATTNVARVVRLAEAGYYDGLTFHRWAPNFVIQGGSPGANEYQGDGPYTRDEVGGTPHWRGTVGISTRGRDTGDGQIFINLVHNPRLDHDYTVIGRVVAGHEALDAVLEGDVIERAVVTAGP